MRREAAIIAGVLVPFALLVGLSWWLTQAQDDSPPPPPTPAIPAEAPPPTPRPAAVDAGEFGSLNEATPPNLEAPLRALRPLMQRCFDDAQHAPERVTVQVTFEPRPDGHFSAFRLEESSWADVYLEACVADVFDEATYSPSGAEPRTVTHVFVLSR